MSDINMLLYGEAGDDSLNGGDGNDTLWGDLGHDTLSGGLGNDFLYGDEGNDLMYGGDGNDSLFTGGGIEGTGNDTMFGGGGNDTLGVSFGNSFLYGENGDDSLYGGTGNDWIDGGQGNDLLHGGDGNDSLYGGQGDDYLDGSEGNDYLEGGDGNDMVLGGQDGGNDTLYGNDGDDHLNGLTGDDSMDGGDGNDTLWGDLGHDTLSGGLGNDYLYGDEGNDLMDGGDGNDLLFTGGGVEGTGNDTMFGGEGNDMLGAAFGNNVLYGENGDDSLYGGTGNDWMDGGQGNDWLHGGEGNDLADGGVGNDSMHGNNGDDTLFGGQGDDWMDGSDGDDSMQGGDGNDLMVGNPGNDVLSGDAGNDTCHGGIGNDSLYGGQGNDYLDGSEGNDYLEGGDGNDTVLGGQNGGNDILYGNDGDDHINGIDGDDFLYGGAGNDTFYGEAGNDVMYGGAGNDNILSGAGDNGNDTLLGEGGNDMLAGGNGNDILTGGTGNDIISGGSDVDTVVFSGNFADYIVTYDLATSAFTVLDSIIDRDGTDLVGGVETFKFADVTKAAVTMVPPDSGPIGSGLVTTDFGGGVDAGFGVALQGDGKILVTAISNEDFAVVRYSSDGTLDTSFSGDGKLTTDFGGSPECAVSVAVQSDGKIVVAGQSYNGVDFILALARYNPDGSLDTTFGGGDGKVTGDMCPVSLSVQSDGKILVAGNDLFNHPALARYNSDGSLDLPFGGGDGMATINGGQGTGTGVFQLSNGKILVAGYGWNGANNDFVLVRLTADGNFDTSFDSDGMVVTGFGAGCNDKAHSLVVQSDGKILMAGFQLSGSGGSYNENFALLRYNTDGSLDTTFGSGNGKIVTDLGGYDQCYSMTVQSDGKILLAGHSNSSIALVRYNVNGSIDSTFSSDGIVTTNIGAISAVNGSGDIYTGMGVTVQTDGKILVTGQSNGDLALVRYNTDGSLDTSFTGVSDTTAPTVSAFSPVDGTTGAAIGSDIVVTFSEAIQNGTGTIAIHTGSETGAIVESYNAATSTNLTLSGSTLTINPTASLLNTTHYYVTFSEGSVKDLAENNYAGSTSYDFTTEDPVLTPVIHNGVSVMPEYYTGPATAAGGAPINFQYLGDNTGEVLIGTANNDFINIGGGVDAVDAGAGNDVIDGGTDSNFLTGGAGIDIFFSDGRGGVTTWSTITDWQAGEQLSVWGWTPGTSRIVEWTQAGAAGYEGLTMHADLNGDGTIDTSVTFSGLVSQSQLPVPLEFDGVLWFT